MGEMMNGNLDETDMRILCELMDDGRLPAKQLAKKIKVHPNTLLVRLKRLEKETVIQNYTANVDYDRLGFEYHVIIMLKLKKWGPGDEKTLGNIKEMKELEALYATTGAWDVLSLWRAKDKEHLSDILKRLAGHSNISRTLTHTILHTYKSPRNFNPLKGAAPGV
jgi:Lrp/AsnC family transcriptional regulator for asnA, asnC and gidA